MLSLHLGEVGLATNGVEAGVALQLVRDGCERYRLAALGEGQRCLVAPAILFAEEVLGLHQRQHPSVGVVVQQQRSDHRFLGGDVMRRQPAR